MPVLHVGFALGQKIQIIHAVTVVRQIGGGDNLGGPCVLSLSQGHLPRYFAADKCAEEPMCEITIWGGRLQELVFDERGQDFGRRPGDRARGLGVEIIPEEGQLGQLHLFCSRKQPPGTLQRSRHTGRHGDILAG